MNTREVGTIDLEGRFKSRGEVWKSICAVGIVVYGDAPGNLRSIAKGTPVDHGRVHNTGTGKGVSDQD
jgi:hypothetical protein